MEKINEQDLEKFAAIVREYHQHDRSDPDGRIEAYQAACNALEGEIGFDRMELARDEYDERQFRACEAREDAWIESHYR